MQLFDRRRVSPPAWLSGPEAVAARAEYSRWTELDPVRRAQTPSPAGRLSLAQPDILQALSALFRGRCAFCESIDEVRPHRFRPATEATPITDPRESHLYYGWLSEAWDNIHALCRGCAPTDPTWFPVTGGRTVPPDQVRFATFDAAGDGSWGEPVEETPLLLDPTGAEDPWLHLNFGLDGQVTGKTGPGRETITHFNLNRRDLRRRRRIAFQSLMSELLAAIPTPGDQLDLLSVEEIEFGGGWMNLLGQILRPFGEEIGSAAQVVEAVSALRGTPGSRPRLLQMIRRTQQIQRGWPAPATDEAVSLKRRLSAGARLTSFRLQRFKGVEDLFLRLNAGPVAAPDEEGWRPRTPALLILGENAAGKSSVLEALALGLCDTETIDDLRRRHGVRGRDLVMDPTQVGDGATPDVRQALVELNFEDGDNRFLTVRRRGLSAVGREDLPLVFAYGAFRQFLNKRPPPSPSGPVVSLFRSDYLLPDPEAWLIGLDPGEFDLVLRALHDILSYHGPYDVIEVIDGRVIVVTSEPDASGTEVARRTPLSVVSSGFRSVLAMVCDIMRGLLDADGFETFTNARAIVLIDEVEAHLHPRWKVRILPGLRKALPQVTFIATTHDPLCVRGAEREEVAVLRRISGEGSDLGLPAFVEAVTDIPAIDYLTIEQLLTSDLFSLYSTDKPVTEYNFARIGDLLGDESGRDRTLEQTNALNWFRDHIAEALPLGSTEIQRIVEEAVADYLRKRRGQRSAEVAALRTETRDRIAAALRDIAG